jgi:hypothetical protein
VVGFKFTSSSVAAPVPKNVQLSAAKITYSGSQALKISLGIGTGWYEICVTNYCPNGSFLPWVPMVYIVLYTATEITLAGL